MAVLAQETQRHRFTSAFTWLLCKMIRSYKISKKSNMKLKKKIILYCVRNFFFFNLGKASQIASLTCVPAKPQPAAGTGPEGDRVTADREQRGACSGGAERRSLCRWLSYRAASRKMRIWLIQPTHHIKNQAKR